MSRKINQPFAIIVVSIVILFFSALNGLRFLKTVFFEKTLLDYHARPGTLYLAGTGAFWFIVGITLLWGLWSGRPWGRSITISMTLSYALWYWLDRLIFQSQDINWPFSIIATIILILLICLGMNLKTTIRYFRR